MHNFTHTCCQFLRQSVEVDQKVMGHFCIPRNGGEVVMAIEIRDGQQTVSDENQLRRHLETERGGWMDNGCRMVGWWFDDGWMMVGLLPDGVVLVCTVWMERKLDSRLQSADLPKKWQIQIFKIDMYLYHLCTYTLCEYKYTHVI